MTNLDMEQKLCVIFREFAGEDEDIVINLDTRIDTLRLDSLDVLDLLMQIENELKVNIPIEKFALCEDIRAIKIAIESL